ncbi:LysR family transcriptional regulator [Blautia schinkii]|nr:LysR family transcriptional regulator [Blautia schinkii]
MLQELKTFIAVVKYRNFTKAGEAVNLSQPAVSTHINRLEKYYGTRLVVRSPKSIQITDNGWMLYRRAQEVLDLLQQAEQEQRETGQELKGNLKIGATYTVGECVMPGILRRFQNTYPGVQLEMVIANTEDILELVRKEQIQAGFIEGVYQREEFTGRFFMQDSLKLLVSKESPLAKAKVLHPHMLKNQNWIFREEGSGTREYMDFFLSRYQIEPGGVTVMGSNYAIKEAVRHNMGITLASGLLVREGDEIVAVDFAEPFVRPFSYVIHRETEVSRAVTALIELVEHISLERQLAQETGSGYSELPHISWGTLYEPQTSAEEEPAGESEGAE